MSSEHNGRQGYTPAEPIAASPRRERAPWVVAIVDDEQMIHTITTMVLRKFAFDGASVEFISAYSAAEARALLTARRDVAAALIDIVMEEDDAGLQLIRWIREDLGDSLMRLIVRTGQPGMAPEEEVIQRYEVNDYRLKTELTETRLRTSLSAALRNYRDLVSLESSRHALERMVAATTSFWSAMDVPGFVNLVVGEAHDMLYRTPDHRGPCSVLATAREDDGYRIVQGGGHYAGFEGREPSSVLEGSARSSYEMVLGSTPTAHEANSFAARVQTSTGEDGVFLISCHDPIQPMEREILEAYFSTVRLAAENIALTNHVKKAEQDMLFFLADVVERHSETTGNHIRRVSHLVTLLAHHIFDDNSLSEEWGLASTLHDVGKIAVPESLLHKPGPLTPDERAIVEHHTIVGYELLSRNDGPFFRVAADIARSHHERWDGRGYRDHKSGEEISPVSRITAVVDVFDALTHTRSYKHAWSFADARELLESEKKSHFDPEVVEAFIASEREITDILTQYPD